MESEKNMGLWYETTHISSNNKVHWPTTENYPSNSLSIVNTYLRLNTHQTLIFFSLGIQFLQEMLEFEFYRMMHFSYCS